MGFFLLFYMVLCLVHPVPVFAAEWSLDQIYLENSDPEDYLQVDTVIDASDSNALASGSNAYYGIMPLSGHSPYDNGSISSTIVNYMSDVLPKLGNVHYVLFRSGQYVYRLYYTKDMEYDGAGGFMASKADYISYDSRYYTWSSGSETNFSLDAGSYLVYSDLGEYPMLSSGESSTWLLVVLGAAYFLFVIIRSFLAPSKFVI